MLAQTHFSICIAVLLGLMSSVWLQYSEMINVGRTILGILRYENNIWMAKMLVILIYENNIEYWDGKNVGNIVM